MRAALFDRGWMKTTRIGVPVLSVGNLSAGGTGKTPLVRYILSRYARQGLRVGVLLRGYRRQNSEISPLIVRDAGGVCCDQDEAGDEAYLLAINHDAVVAVGKDRVTSSRHVVERENVRRIILDDGFQYRRLHRDLDIVTMRSSRSPFDDFLLPYGDLREPVEALKRAQLVLCYRDDGDAGEIAPLSSRIREIRPDMVIVEASLEPLYLSRPGEEKRIPLARITSETVAIACAIADPSSFEGTLGKIGAIVGERFFFPDHHRFTREEVRDICRNCKAKNLSTLVITEKDEVKFPPLEEHYAGIDLLVLKVGVEVHEGRDRFHRMLDQLQGDDACAKRSRPTSW